MTAGLLRPPLQLSDHPGQRQMQLMWTQMLCRPFSPVTTAAASINTDSCHHLCTVAVTMSKAMSDSNHCGINSGSIGIQIWRYKMLHAQRFTSSGRPPCVCASPSARSNLFATKMRGGGSLCDPLLGSLALCARLRCFSSSREFPTAPLQGRTLVLARSENPETLSGPVLACVIPLGPIASDRASLCA